MSTGLTNINLISDRNVLQSNKAYQKNTIGTGNQSIPSKLSKNQKLGIQMCTALGIISSIALLAKCSKTPYSFKFSKIISTPFKDTFLGKEEYDVAKVLTIGAGSCLGGYLGGLIFDKNKNNRQAKKREALVQYTNISLPICTVSLFKLMGEFITSKLPSKLVNSPYKLTRFMAKTPESILPMVGLGLGMYIGNKASNKLNQKIFHNKDERPIEIGDFSAHLDDICMTSQYIAKDNILTNVASRFIPLALMVPGCEIGKRQEKV